MNKLFERERFALTRIDTDVPMRAVAICAVVWNHANPGAEGGLGGGMTFLMMLSGFNFARFSLRGATPKSTRNALVNLSVRIGVPSLLLVLFFFIALRKFDWTEILFIRNWWTIDRISVFPTWYPQVMLQMFMGLWLLFLTPAGRVILARPLIASVAIFLAGVVVRKWFPLMLWDTTYLHNNLPHLYLWNFTLGWVVFFLVADGERRPFAIFGAIVLIALGSYIGWGWHLLDFWWLVSGGAFFAVFRTVPLPKIVAKALGVVSQAAFAIFLLHRVSFVALNHICPKLEQEPLYHFLFAIVASISAWVLLTAIGRAYRQLRALPTPPRTMTVMPRPA